MMRRLLRLRPGLTYFAYTGWLIAAVVGFWFLNQLRLGAYGWMLTKQLLAVAGVTAVSAGVVLANPRMCAPIGPWIAHRVAWSDRVPAVVRRLDRASVLPFGCLVFLAVAIYLLRADHRFFVVIIALLQAFTIYRLRRRMPLPTRGWVVAVSILSWSLASGLTYTHLADWFVGAGGASALTLPAFVLAFALVIYELSDERPLVANCWWAWPTLVAVLLFGAFALRTDHLFADWVPWHRGYFADVAQYVRDGHWLLWDAPTVYGFLSILTLSWMPASNGYQAVYELTALFLFLQSCMAFTILRWGRQGWLNATFAIAFPLAMIFTGDVARYPMSVRLYPQGGLRFFWVDALLFVAFLMYTQREHTLRVSRLRWLGHAMWCISLFWSFETGAWETALWLPFLVAELLVGPKPSRPRLLSLLVQRFWPVLVLPALGLLLTDVVYLGALHARADWRAFVAGTGFFVSGHVRAVFWVQTLGAGWSILLALGALGTVGLLILRRKHREAAPLVTMAWLAVWATASYFAVEPLDMYVTFLLSVSAIAVSVLIFLTRETLAHATNAFIARYSMAPIAILTIAFAWASPSHLAAMEPPLTPGWRFDALHDAPALPRELTALMHRARISPHDKVLLPFGSYWSELDQGLILPFDRNNRGEVVQYHSWLPISPNGVGQFVTALAPAERQLLIDRTLDRHPVLGWYVTYRMPADCSALSSQLKNVRTLSSTNFSATLCAYRSDR